VQGLQVRLQGHHEAVLRCLYTSTLYRSRVLRTEQARHGRVASRLCSRIIYCQGRGSCLPDAARLSRRIGQGVYSGSAGSAPSEAALPAILVQMECAPTHGLVPWHGKHWSMI
jgi:hypothetical protein